MIRTLVKPVIFFILTLILATFVQGDLEEHHGKAMIKYKLEGNFKNFMYMGEKEGLVILKPDVVENGKTFSGVRLSINEEGVIRSLAPVFGPDSDQLQIMKWAFESAANGLLTGNSLWEIIRAQLPRDTGGDDAFMFMISQLQQKNNASKMKNNLILPCGSFKRTIEKQYKEADHDELRERLQLLNEGQLSIGDLLRDFK